MGYYLFSNGIKTDKIQAVFGSKDQALLQEVEESSAFDNYGHFTIEDIETNTYKALEHIINGTPQDTQAGFAYGYAIVCLCDVLGAPLPNYHEIKLGVETDLIKTYLKEDFGINDIDLPLILLADNTNPFPIPAIEDWPVIGLVKTADLALLCKELEAVKITDEQLEGLDEEKEFIYEHIREFIENIQFCVKNDLDLITFCH